jgi:hypothetical protein
MKTRGFFVALLSMQLAAVAVADVPVTFQPGTPAKAAEVNQNFSNLDSRLNASLGGIIVSSFFSSADAVASAVCPNDTLVLSANCDCDGDGTSRNYGVLFACVVAGNGGVAGCFYEGLTYNQFLLDPRATVEVVCGGAVRNDGTTILPVPLSQSAVISGTAESKPDAESIKVASDELEATVKQVNDQLLDIKAKVRSGTN